MSKFQPTKGPYKSKLMPTGHLCVFSKHGRRAIAEVMRDSPNVKGNRILFENAWTLLDTVEFYSEAKNADGGVRATHILRVFDKPEPARRLKKAPRAK